MARDSLAAFERGNHEDPIVCCAYQVLLLQAADEGRGPALFGESLGRAREAVLPFLVGEHFPIVYLEHPSSASRLSTSPCFWT